MNDILVKIKQRLEQSEKVLLVTHNSPDADGLASVCLMIELLEAMNKKYLAYCLDQAPKFLSFLPNIEKITSNNDWQLSEFDTIVSLDCGSTARTALAEEIKNRRSDQVFIEIDHHQKIDNYSDLEVRDPEAASTTEVLYSFFKINNIEISKSMANCILAGIVTDTGNFIYPSTSQATIAIASEMLSLGARLPQIVDQTWRNKSLAGMKLWGLAMSRLQINSKTNIAWTVLTLEDFKQLKASDDDIDGVSGFIGNMPNVKAVMILRQTKPQLIKGSFRTNQDNINVAELARKFDGGGHAKAAGFLLKGDLKFLNNKWRIVN